MNVVMPKLGLTMERGILVRWLVCDGDSVREGDPIAEIATDKVDHELAAPATGTIRNMCSASEDVEVDVGTVIAAIDM